MLAGPLDDLAGDGVDGAGPEQRPRQDEHGADRIGRRIGEGGHQPVLVQYAEDEESAGAEDRHHRGGEALGEEAGEHQPQDDEPDRRLVRLDIGVDRGHRDASIIPSPASWSRASRGRDVRGVFRLHADDVVAGVDMMGFAGDAAG